MRILVLNYEFPPVGGGGGRFSEDVCRQLAARGHEIRVLTGCFRGLPRDEERDGYRIHRAPCLRRSAHTCSIPEMAAFLAGALLPAWRLASGWKPDVVHVHFAVPTGVLAWFLRKACGVRYVLSTQLGDVPGGVPDQTARAFRVILPLTRSIWRDAAAVTAPHERIRELARRTYDVPIDVVPNGVNLADARRADPTPHAPVRLLFAGRFNPQKNLLFLLDVLQGLVDLDWRLDMIGDGPLMGDVRGRAESAGIAARLTFHGWVAPARVAAAMEESDILVLPSLSEGVPVVGMQALAAGLAVVASDVGGVPDVVRDGVNGYLCPAGDGKAFASRLRALLVDPALLRRMKEASAARAAEFDMANLAVRVEDLLRRAAERER